MEEQKSNEEVILISDDEFSDRVTDAIEALTLNSFLSEDDSYDHDKTTKIIKEIINLALEDCKESVESLNDIIETQNITIKEMQAEFSAKTNRNNAMHCIDLDRLRAEAKSSSDSAKRLNNQLLAVQAKLDAFESRKSLNASATTFVPGAPSPPRQKPSTAPSAQMNVMSISSSDISAAGMRLKQINSSLYSSVVCSVKMDSRDNKDERIIVFSDTLHRLRLFFIDGVLINSVIKVIDCVLDMATATSLTRQNSAALLVLLSNKLEMTICNTSFFDILMRHILETFDSKIGFIKKNDFAGGAYDYAVFCTEFFLCLMEENKEVTRDLVHKLKELIMLLSDNKIGSLKCLVNVLKLSGSKLYEAERLFGPQGISMDHIFDLIKQVVVTKETVDRCTRRQLMAVIELRAAEWGDDLGPLNKILANEAIVNTEPIYVNSSGSIPPEMQQSLQPHHQYTHPSTGLADYLISDDVDGDEIADYIANNYYIGEDEFDEEMMQAFEEFSAQK